MNSLLYMVYVCCFCEPENPYCTICFEAAEREQRKIMEFKSRRGYSAIIMMDLFECKEKFLKLNKVNELVHPYAHFVTSSEILD